MIELKKVRKQTLVFGSTLLMLICLVIACSDDKSNTITLDPSQMYTKLSAMENILDTAQIGTVDGTFPQANANSLQAAVENLKVGISKMKGDMFVLQFEIDNYCIAADKAIFEFQDSYQYTLIAGTPGELIVYGIDKKGHIDFGDAPEFSSSPVFTVETWVKYRENFFEFAIADLVGTFSHDGNGTKQGWMINFSGENLRTTIGVGPAKDRVLEFGKPYPKTFDEWIHVVTVYDDNAESDNLKMYLNGELFFVKTNDVKDGGAIQKYQANTRKMSMYAFMEAEDNARCMTGFMKKFRMWNTAKTEAEIKALMSTEVTGKESNLICAWDFTHVPENNDKIIDKTGKHTAKLVGSYKWRPMPTNN